MSSSDSKVKIGVGAEDEERGGVVVVARRWRVGVFGLTGLVGGGKAGRYRALVSMDGTGNNAQK